MRIFGILKICIFSDCGKPYVRTELLISGGLNTTIGEFPWNVAIYDHAQEHHKQLICAGTIVTPYLVISGNNNTV